MGLGELGALTQEEREDFYRNRICVPTPTFGADVIERAQWFQVHANLEQYPTVLDIGCHDGFVTRWLGSAEFPCRVVGIDPCQAAIAAAHELAAKEAHPDRLEYFQGTWQEHEAQCRSETFAAVVAFELIEHFPEDEIKELLRFMDRKMVTGSQAFITTPEISGQWGSINPEREHITLFSAETLTTLLESTLGVTPAIELSQGGLLSAWWEKCA